MQTLIDLLGAQHGDVLARLEAAEGLVDDGAAVADLVGFLRGEVMDHFRLEEEALFPVLAEHPGIAGGPLRVMHAEHESFRALLAEAEGAVAEDDRPRRAEAALALIGLLRAHIAKEDGVLFPMARSVLSDEQLRRIDARAPAPA